MLHADQGFRITMNDTIFTYGVLGLSTSYAVIIFIFLLPVYETFHYFARLETAEKHQAYLEKEKLKAELNLLKGIVNPHFLFNNLNSLSSLISENPAQAEIFLDELTKVFRYLLRSHQNELTPLTSELELMQSYFHLLQTRFGKAIQLNLQIDASFHSLLLPPLTLQLLVENAVKHNHYHKDHPLLIEIFTQGTHQLIVRNTFRKKEGRAVESTGIGLSSINSRYLMLERQGLHMEQSNDWYTVIVFLIAPSEANNSTVLANSTSNASLESI
jgi:LytS/YehU family sensor histidine kinase